MTELVVRSVLASGIGAFELKRSYQKHMFWATLFSSLAALSVIGGISLYDVLQSRENNAPHQVVFRRIVIMDPVPSMIYQKPQIAVLPPRAAPPPIGIPVPVPDNEVREENNFPTPREMAERAAPPIGGPEFGGADAESLVFAIPEKELMPAPDVFIPVEEMPMPVYVEGPPYPPMAERAGIEGVVSVNMLVDKEGKVRQVQLKKASGTNAGFEEAALEASYKFRYTPAIQNSRPIAVWVTYRFVFELK